ncbi:MAG: DNA gyrase subunit A [Candidatus Sericytochromatia bacterium]|nr:DNA gyrase subunit A [Candidatus Tanganyikabacteria bacterium]
MGDFPLCPEALLTDSPQSKVLPRSLREELKQSYLDYAMSVIVGRALPDVRDGLKPVHRRILYSMHENNLTSDRKHRKSATVVGDVLGKYHPHGDASVYDAMVRLAQDFSIRYPLIDGHGNFGSADGDPAAAYRYTEARLSRIASELLVDIDAETVNFLPNYDGTTEEPTVLPSRIPNLLINGSAGIAVGMATNIPPHNLTEVIDALCALIDQPSLTSSDLMTFVKGPDFPTGAIIMGERGIHEAYTTGRGSITLRAVCSVEEIRKDKMAIVATQLPYQVGPDPLLEKIADLVKDKKIEGISDLRNESDRDGIRVVIELKRDAIPQVVLNNLYKQTALQTSFGIIFLALVKGQPKILSLREMLGHYLDHRFEVVTRRCQYEKRKAEARLHIVEGLLVCQNNIDEVIRLIRGAANTEEAREGLMTRFGLSEIQANAILEMQLRRLTQLERGKLEEEERGLKARIAELAAILADPAKVYAIVKAELVAVRDKYGDARRTQLEHAPGEFRHEDLIPDEDMAVFMTDQGYIKRLAVDTFERQGRGGKGITGMSQRDGDFIRHFFVASAHQPVLFFTNRGVSYSLKTYELPEASRTAKGSNIANLLPLNQDEKVTAVIPVKAFSEGAYLLMLTRLGTIKKTDLTAFSSIRKSGIIAISLDDGDELGWVALTAGNSDVSIGTAEGMAIRFPEDELRPLGRPARGVRAITLRKGDKVIGMALAQPDCDLLTVTTDGYGKRTPLSEYRPQGRGGLGLINMKLNTKRNGKVANILVVREIDEVVLVTTNGIVIRQKVADIGRYGRMTQGVRLQRLNEDDRVAGVAPLVVEDQE